MKDKEAKRIIEIFKSKGMRIELGAQFSVKGQVAQLLNGCEQILREHENSADRENEGPHFPCCGGIINHYTWCKNNRR